jgi:protein-disulfide isomerase
MTLMHTLSAAVLALGVGLAPLADPASAAALNDAQKSEVEQLVRDYIRNNPEALLESLRGLDERQRQAAEKGAQQAIVANRSLIEADPTSPVAGNPNGDVTVVEFFDYRCGYCKKAVASMQDLLKSDGNVRWVFKEFPILSPESVTAARAALAVWSVAPDKYLPFHVALMESRGDMSEARILETAQKVGIDPNTVKAKMADPEIQKKIEQNHDLARTLQINGTPAFIIGDKLTPGAVDAATLREMVKAARAG